MSVYLNRILFFFNNVHVLSSLIQHAEAVYKYRSVLRSVEGHKEEIRTDELQQLHTLYNLEMVMSAKPKGVPPTLRDSLLLDQVRAFLSVSSKTKSCIPIKMFNKMRYYNSVNAIYFFPLDL